MVSASLKKSSTKTSCFFGCARLRLTVRDDGMDRMGLQRQGSCGAPVRAVLKEGLFEVERPEARLALPDPKHGVRREGQCLDWDVSTIHELCFEGCRGHQGRRVPGTVGSRRSCIVEQFTGNSYIGLERLALDGFKAALSGSDAVVNDQSSGLLRRLQMLLAVLQCLRRPRFSWTRIIRGESDVEGGGGHGWVEASAGSGVGADGGSPEGERGRRGRREPGGRAASAPTARRLGRRPWRLGSGGARAGNGTWFCGFCAASRWRWSRVKSG